ncbi:MAG: hypothetical protein EB133_07525 [Betaproteobacteria bacterium]|nr:hypothetical protein [Betaproteobacteria bacterium]
MLFDNRSTIPARFEAAIHTVIDRTRAYNKVTLAVIYGQFPWESSAADAADAEVQLALILDDDVTDFVATKLELTKTAYDVFIESGIEIAPFPVPVTHWYLPSKAANPALIEDIRKHGLRINLDRVLHRARPAQAIVRPASEIISLLSDARDGLVRDFAVQSLFFIPQVHPTRSLSPEDCSQDEEREVGPLDILIDFGGRPSTERVLGVQEAIESALEMPVQLLTTSSIRKALLDLLMKKAVEIGAGASSHQATVNSRLQARAGVYADLDDLA